MILICMTNISCFFFSFSLFYSLVDIHFPKVTVCLLFLHFDTHNAFSINDSISIKSKNERKQIFQILIINIQFKFSLKIFLLVKT